MSTMPETKTPTVEPKTTLPYWPRSAASPILSKFLCEYMHPAVAAVMIAIKTNRFIFDAHVEWRASGAPRD